MILFVLFVCFYLVTCLLQRVRPELVKAHEALLRATDLLTVVEKLMSSFQSSKSEKCGESFVELGSVWQAPMYEITLNYQQSKNTSISFVSHFRVLEFFCIVMMEFFWFLPVLFL